MPDSTLPDSAPPDPRPELFDEAVNRALTYALRLGVPLDKPDRLRGGLEVWYLKTRFAYRVPMADVLSTLATYPGLNYQWKGGAAGRWLPTN